MARWILFLRVRGDGLPPNAHDAHPPSGGAPQFVLETRNAGRRKCARAPASLCVIVEMSKDRKQLTITAFDPMKGRGKVLRTIERDPSHTTTAVGALSGRIDVCYFQSRRDRD